MKHASNSVRPFFHAAARAAAAVGLVLHGAMAGQAAQVYDTPLMDATREFTQDGGPACGTLVAQAEQNAGPGSMCVCPQGDNLPGYPFCSGGAPQQTLTVGQSSGPTLTGSVTNLPTAPTTNAQAPSTVPATDSGGGSAIPPGVTTFCADGWIDTMARPLFGEVLGSSLHWNGGPFIPAEAQYAASPLQSAALPSDPGCYTGSFNWIGGANGLSTCINSTAGWMQASVQINPDQTFPYLANGPSGTCAQLFQACQADQGFTALNTTTLSTETQAIGGPDCVNYYGNCQVPALLSQQGTAFLSTQDNPQGTTAGLCQTFASTPTCSTLLPLYQESAPNYICSCPSQTSTPVCTVKCADIVQAWQADVGPAAVCSCPAATGAPVCQPACLGQLGSAQSSLGGTYDCGCSANGGNANTLAPVQTAQPQPTSDGFYSPSHFPDSTAQLIYGTNAANPANGSSENLTQTFSSTVASGTLYVVADDAATVSLNGVAVGTYSDGGAGQGGLQAYPSTGGVVAVPVTLKVGANVLDVTLSNSCLACAPTGNPSSLLLAIVGSSGQVITHTDSSWNLVSGGGSAPTCTLNCSGQAQVDQLANPGYVCSCPSGPYALTAPSCAPTCAVLATQQQAQLGSGYSCACQTPSSTTEQPSCPMNCSGLLATQPAYQSNANQVCSCPSGAASLTTPSCQPTCGSLMATQAQYQTNASQVCSCTSGAGSVSTPSCQPTCGAQLAGAQAAAGSGYACFCPSGDANLGAPSCALNCQGIMATNATYQSNASQTCSCPSGGASLTTPSCVQSGHILWTTQFAGQYNVYHYPAMYWVSVNFNPGGQLSFSDVSGEGYGAPGPTTPSSCNATVVTSPLILAPLYANATDQANCAPPTGYVAFRQFRQCSGRSGTCAIVCQAPYQYGGGVNAAARNQYCSGGSF